MSDLERSLGFYGDVLGFRVLDRAAGTARLGGSTSDRGSSDELMVLVEDSGVRPVVPRTRLGLFHFAVLLPSRADLGRLLRHLRDCGVPVGTSDHGVSEALYLTDPDGLGMEIYRDRPRSEWRTHGRELAMTTEPLDGAAVMSTGAECAWEGFPSDTLIGHIHLHVGDLAEAAGFYHEGLGLDKMVWSYPGALFLAAGGYHHHLGVNTWAAGARPSGDDDARLLDWSLIVSDGSVVEAVRASLEGAGYSVDRAGRGIRARDPWGTTVRVRPADRLADRAG